MKESYLLCLIFISCITISTVAISEEETRAQNYLNILEDKESDWLNKGALAEWAYASNLTDENLKAKLKVNAAIAEYCKVTRQEIQQFNWKNFSDKTLKRQFKLYYEIGLSALSAEKYEKVDSIISKMQDVYSKAHICVDAEEKNCDNALEPVSLVDGDTVTALPDQSVTELTELSSMTLKKRNIIARQIS